MHSGRPARYAPPRRATHRQHLVDRGKVAVPHPLPYSASKFALTGLSEGLSAESARDGFAVTTVRPGPMRTGRDLERLVQGRTSPRVRVFLISDSLPGLSIGARRAARQIIDACRHGIPELLITPAARTAVLLNAVSPASYREPWPFANRLLPSPTLPGGMRHGPAGKVSPDSCLPPVDETLGPRERREQ